MQFASVARAGATTQPTTAPADQRLMAHWLSELASQDAAIRESARDHLMHMGRSELPALQQLVAKQRPLAPSQAAGLRQIVQEIYLAGEVYEKDPTHGFLGILMDESAFTTRDLQQPNDNTQIPGVVVADRFAGFCASRSLRDGDVILGTVDPPQVFNSPTDLKFAVSGLEPGSVIQLQVLRHGQVIQIPLTLDSKPTEVDNLNAAEGFRARRAVKFDQYWQQSFAPLLKESLG
jgi:hypothetical protein